MTRKDRILYLCGVILICVALRLFCHQTPCSKRAAKQTDQAVVQLEQTIKSQDATVIRIVTSAQEEVTARNEIIRKDVQALSSDHVAFGLVALLTEYRRERGD